MARSATLAELLRQVRNQHVASRPHKQTALVEIRRCSKISGARALFDTFVVHFSELNHFEGPARPTVERAAVKVDIDLAAGLSASAADVTVHITGVLDRRRRLDSGLRLGGIPWSLSQVYAPCRSARIEAGHAVVPGVPRIKDGPPVGSSAFLAVAETWARL